MTTGEWLLLAAGAALGAALALLAVLAVARRRRRGASAGGAGAAGDAGDVRHLGRRIRRLNRIARRAQERVQGQVDELRRLLAKAQRLTGGAPAGGAGGAEPAESAVPAEVPPPAFLQRQRDLVLRLSLQGLEPIDIARRLDMPIGEVELTLKLHEQEKHARAEAGGG